MAEHFKGKSDINIDIASNNKLSSVAVPVPLYSSILHGSEVGSFAARQRPSCPSPVHRTPCRSGSGTYTRMPPPPGVSLRVFSVRNSVPYTAMPPLMLKIMTISRT